MGRIGPPMMDFIIRAYLVGKNAGKSIPCVRKECGQSKNFPDEKASVGAVIKGKRSFPGHISC